MRQIITLLAALIVSVSSIAQSKGSVSGKITDQQNKPMPSATVSLLKGKDSSVVKFTVTDKAGIYQFENISSGQYLVSITAVGHAKSFSKKIEVADQADFFGKLLSFCRKQNRWVVLQSLLINH
jgi:hypothetical protein